MKHFVARRMAPIALVGTLVTGGLFVTSAPANAGVVDDCLGALRSFMGFFRAYDTAAHHEQAPDGLMSRNDVRAAAAGNAEIGELPADQRNIVVYQEVQRAANMFEQLPNSSRIWDRLDVAGRHDQPDGLVSARWDLNWALVAAAGVGGVCESS